MTSGDDTWFTPAGSGGPMGFRDEPAREVGGWRVSAPVGEGGFGKVYLAYKGDRRGALKVLRPDYVSHRNAEAFRKSFESEADILSKLRGPHTAELIDADLAGYTPWIVTRFVPGDTLAYQVKYENPIRGRAWWDVAHGLFSGLSEAHRNGIIHRDIKPSNVMRSADSPAVIIDFGIALISSLPDLWSRAGTDSFQSPEQRRGDGVTQASDIYSAALTLLYVTTKPQSKERQEFTKHDAPGVPFVEDVFDRSSPEADLLRLALSLDPEARPTAEEMVTLCSFRRTDRDSGSVRHMATPAMRAPSSAPPPPPPVMSHGLPEKFSMALPSRPPRSVSWPQVESAVSRALRVKPGRPIQLAWLDEGVELSVFGLHTPHVIVELRVDDGVGETGRRELVERGWAPPENNSGEGWIWVVPGGRRAASLVVEAVVGALRDALGISPAKPEIL